MTTLSEACNIFRVLDDEDNGYITVDKFISSFYNFYQNVEDDKELGENTLKSLITKMKPDKDGKIRFDNFLEVFQQIQPEKNPNLKARRYSQYSIKRFLSAECTELPSVDEWNKTLVELNSDDDDSGTTSTQAKENGFKDTLSIQSDTRLTRGQYSSPRLAEFDDISDCSNWPNRRMRFASSCKNLLENPLLVPSAARRARSLLSAGASPRGSDIHTGSLSQEIGNNFDLLQMQMKRLEQKLNSFQSDQYDLDKKQSSRLKEENKSLMQRINNLEDNLREVEERSYARMELEKKEFKHKHARLEEEKSRELESLQNQIIKLESESVDLSMEIRRYHDESEKKRAEKHALTESLTESDIRISNLQDEFDQLRLHSRMEVENLKKDKEKYERVLFDLSEKSDRVKDEPHLRIQAMNQLSLQHKELEDLHEKLKEENKELLSLMESANKELHDRFEVGGSTSVNSVNDLANDYEHLSKDELMDLLAKDKDSNFRLRDYIEKIIVKVIEKQPSLLEIGPVKK